MKKKLLEVKNLELSFGNDDSYFKALKNISFDIYPNETVSIVGESGSGKSVTAMGVMSLIQKAGGNIENGSIIFDEKYNMVNIEEEKARSIRGNMISMIFQEPMTSLNPVFTVGEQILEALITHKNVSKEKGKQMVIEAMKEVKIAQAEKRYSQYPHELSGGMRQRIMIAMALVCEPKLLIADEPTTALDVTIQAQILWLIKQLKENHGTAVMFITHDLGVVAQISNRVVVMKRGSIIETGTVNQIYNNPEDPYTKNLIESVPKLGNEHQKLYREENEFILEFNNVTVKYPVRRGILNNVTTELCAVDRANFKIKEGQTLGIVGESGCGKSTIAKTVAGLVKPESGEIILDGTNTLNLKGTDLQNFKKNIGMIFQDPFASLSPRRTAAQQISEPLEIHNAGSKKFIQERVEWLINKVGLDNSHLYRYPHEFSGGQRQRLSIARALALEPKLVIADEPVSALDVSVQETVLELFEDLQKELKLTYIFISHDLSVIEKISDWVAVMYFGRIVESGKVKDVLRKTKHDYTKNLIKSVPTPDPNIKMTQPKMFSEIKSDLLLKKGYQFEEDLQYDDNLENHRMLLSS